MAAQMIVFNKFEFFRLEKMAKMYMLQNFKLILTFLMTAWKMTVIAAILKTKSTKEL